MTRNNDFPQHALVFLQAVSPILHWRKESWCQDLCARNRLTVWGVNLHWSQLFFFLSLSFGRRTGSRIVLISVQEQAFPFHRPQPLCPVCHVKKRSRKGQCFAKTRTYPKLRLLSGGGKRKKEPMRSALERAVPAANCLRNILIFITSNSCEKGKEQ